MNWTKREFLFAGTALSFAACSPKVAPARHAKVIILGAGLSGLNAARLLAAEGIDVLVLEAGERIGGRMYTLDDLEGSPEAGGEQVGQSYARIRSTAEDLGLKVVPPAPGGSREKTLVLNDKTFNAQEWASHADNPFPAPLKPFTPDTALFMASMRDNPLTDEDSWRKLAANADISAADFLAKKGLGPDSQRLIDIALNANALDTYSMINVWRTLVLFQRDSGTGPSEEIEGGAQRLPESMANSLGEGRVITGARVTALDVDDAGASIETTNGDFRADYVISTIPLPAMRSIKINAPLHQATRQGIDAVPYTQIQQVHLGVEDAFWEKDGLPAMMWTDTPIERVFPVRNRNGDIVSLTCWINGAGIRKSTTDEDWMALAEDVMMKTRGAKTTARKVIRWDSEQPLFGGAYMHWAPGQVASIAKDIATPAGRLHFAGEHMSFLHTGMEGAMESGERAGFEVFDKITA